LPLKPAGHFIPAAHFMFINWKSINRSFHGVKGQTLAAAMKKL
jgi:hypothetical protein